MTKVTRYTDEELLALLNNIESDRVERKRSFKNDADKARQAVCAFANDLPGHNQAGVLFVGAEDNGEPSNVPITDELLRSLADIRDDGNILPLPVITVEKRILKGAEMAVVVIMPSDMPPVRYKGQICVRVGPRQGIASVSEERILNEKRRAGDVTYDLHPNSRASLKDLSKVFFEEEYLPAAFSRDILEANNRSYEERLSSLRMIYSVEEPLPTVLGLLAIGKNPQEYIFGAYVQFLRFDGTALSDPIIDAKELKGPLPAIIRSTEEKFNAHNRIAVDPLQVPQVNTIDYPYEAFRQILYNALMHRSYELTSTAPVHVYWYSDRIEINSPGGPYGEVTIENFGLPGQVGYRNPNIAEMFKTLGYIQKFGVGIQLARTVMERNGNPPLEFEVDQGFVKCILRKNRKSLL
jgi:ATP-dependent DNA helicase RecG